jgi:tRNA/rRNA methyltransferase
MDPDSFFFILHQPAVPGNIGASARAMKTMGFRNLRLVAPADHLSDEARMLAHGAVDVLERATVFSTWEQAVEDLDFIMTTTAKTSRTAKQDYIHSREIAAFLQQKENLSGKTGIVFGSEESGLPNQVILQSNLAITIPMAGPYPSLNLSQSVMVLSYELSRVFEADDGVSPTRERDQRTWSVLEARVKSILAATGIPPGSPLHHRILERLSFLTAGDINLVHSVSSRIAGKLGLDI